MVREIDRRRFLQTACALAVAGTVPAWAQSGARRPPYARGGRFAQSVASGQPSTSGATLWTRLEGVDRTVRLQVEISPDEDFRRLIYRQDVVADAARDFTVHHRADHRVLQPGEQYFYRFATCDESSPVGRFRTARPADSREPVRIAFFSCQRYPRGYFTPHAALLNEDVDLIVSLGDYIYETGERVRYPDRADRTGADGNGEVQTLAEYRDKYTLYHSDPHLQALRAKHPMVAIWDDHEFENNYAGDGPSPNPEERTVSRRRVSFGERQGAAYAAFFEHLPVLRTADFPRIYGSIPLGGNAEVFLLDTRQYRDEQPCGDVTIQPCDPADRENPARTLLGPAQKAWLKGGLERSTAAWKIVANQVMIMSLDVPARSPVNPDQWDGYAAERRELLEHVSARGVKDVTFLTGDIHTFFAGNVTPSGREGAPPVDGVPVATEFVGGSVTSEGIGDDFRLNEAGVAGELSTEAGVRANNPHIKAADLIHRGYGVLEATQQELKVRFRAVRSVAEPRSEVFTTKEFRVARGSANVENAGPV
jgi:alkaline phosphatase D